jgi:hypothetical protein
MPELSSDPKQFVQGAPVLHVSDVVATAAFCRDVLGFTRDFGDETCAVVWRDNSAVHFVRDDASPKGVHLFQWVKDVDATIESWIEGPTGPSDQPYGIREFGLRDANGVILSWSGHRTPLKSSILVPHINRLQPVGDG